VDGIMCYIKLSSFGSLKGENRNRVNKRNKNSSEMAFMGLAEWLMW
jgi:hypothetical protein